MKKFYLVMMAVVATASLFAQTCYKPFFSEYVEGSGNNKALEIYNPTSAPIDLLGYKVKLFTNGSVAASITFNLNGVIAPGDVYVIANNQANDSIKLRADTVSGVTSFTGNDAVALLYNNDTIDVIGIIGNDPGNSGWTVGAGSTFDKTLVRRDTVKQGTTSWTIGATEWIVFPRDTIRLGAHTGPTNLTPCTVTGADTLVSFAPTTGTFVGASGNYDLNLAVNLPHTSAYTVDVQLLSGNATFVNNYTTQTVTFAANSQAQLLPITITNGSGLPQTVSFRMLNASTGLKIAPDSIFTLTLLLTVNGPDTCPKLFFSEYVEGSSNNKALEIYNPTSTPIDMHGYKVQLYVNGATTANTTLNLNKILNPGAVYVIANSQANDSIKAKADTLSGVASFNGNDAIVLLRGTDTLDIIGIFGNDPGNNGWTVGTGSTTDRTLTRNSTVLNGTTSWALAVAQWNVLPRDTIRLGAHTGPQNLTPCGIAVADTTVQFVPDTGSFTGASGSFLLNLELNTPHTTAYTVDVELKTGNSAMVNNFTTQTVTFPANVVGQQVPLTITNPGGLTQTLTFRVANTSTGLIVGEDSIFTLNLFPAPVGDTCGGLFFSEYVEGSGNNKALEIYNPTSNPVNLLGYKIQLFINGTTTANNTFNLNAILAPGDVYVIANSAAGDSIKAKADTLSSVAGFNGNDAIALVYNLDTLDIIGIIGNDPSATGWPVGNGSTTDRTLVRKPAVQKGTTDWTLGTTQWNVLQRDTIRLGAHTGPTAVNQCPIVSGIGEITADNIARIYPNPNTGSFVIELENNSNIAEVSLFDLTGRMVYFSKETGNNLRINLNQMNAGLYLVEVKADGVVSRSKITVQQ